MATLNLIGEAKIHTLLPGCREESRLEASGVLLHEGRLVIIFDNLSEIARIDASLSSSASSEWLGQHHSESGHEDITYNPREQRFYVLVESAAEAGEFHAEIVELDGSFQRQATRALPVSFTSDNKGFEGLTYLERDGHDFILALCEGNRCRGGRKGRQTGNGRIKVFRRSDQDWELADTIKLPASAAFIDYSSIDIKDGHVAVLSQESSQVWLGTLDAATWAFVDDGAVHDLPRQTPAAPDYCNAEGIAWLAPDQLAIVSDKQKPGQGKRCLKKDQMLHVFQIV